MLLRVMDDWSFVSLLPRGDDSVNAMTIDGYGIRGERKLNEDAN